MNYHTYMHLQPFLDHLSGNPIICHLWRLCHPLRGLSVRTPCHPWLSYNITCGDEEKIRGGNHALNFAIVFMISIAGLSPQSLTGYGQMIL